jgi:uncharacterized membrane protein
MIVIRYLLIWLCAFVFTSAVDALWHIGIFGEAYVTGLKPMARMKGDKMAFLSSPGLLAQALIVSGFVFLVLYKAQRGTLGEAVLVGVFAGILAISTYGATNYALFKDWNLRLTILEVIWGPLLGGLSGAFIFLIKKVILGR